MIQLAFKSAVIMAGIGALVCFISAYKFTTKRALRIFEAFIFLYLSGVYCAAYLELWKYSYLLRAGFLPVIGLIFLTLLFVIEIIADWGR